MDIRFRLLSLPQSTVSLRTKSCIPERDVVSCLSRELLILRNLRNHSRLLCAKREELSSRKMPQKCDVIETELRMYIIQTNTTDITTVLETNNAI